MSQTTRKKPRRKASRSKSKAPGKPKAAGSNDQYTADEVFAGISEIFGGDLIGAVFGGSQPKNGGRHEAKNGEPEHEGIRQVPLYQIEPSPENIDLYRPVDPADPEIVALAASIKQHGLLEPLILTADDYVISGHRRLAAATLAGLDAVPCRVLDIRRTDNLDAYVRLLREHNRQRDKTRAEKLREELVTINPDDEYDALIEYRRSQAVVKVAPLVMGDRVKRSEISDAKLPFLQAVLDIVETLKTFWPLSDRSIHYRLLKVDPPLRHASKPDSRYGNTRQSWQSLIDLLTRARLDGSLPWEAIADTTRPVLLWDAYPDSRSFIRGEFQGLLRGFWRNLQQSQPNHLEIVAEKLTVLSIIKPVAAEFCIPLTIGRGYCSLPPRREMAERFKASGKDTLVLLLLSDFDPDGDEISASFARSLRDDFGIKNIHPVRVALTREQVKRFDLPPIMQAKESSAHHRKFVERHGSNDVFELEALDPEQLQDVLREAIESVIDRDALDAEIAAEKADAAHLAAVRRTVLDAIKDMDLGGDDE